MTDRSTEEFAAESSPSQDTIPLAKQFQVMSETKKNKQSSEGNCDLLKKTR